MLEPVSERRRAETKGGGLSPASMRIMLHYKERRIAPGWSLKRFNRLAQKLNCTHFELGVLCGLYPGETKACIKRDEFPLSASIHLAIIDSFVEQWRYGKVGETITPIDLISDYETIHRNDNSTGGAATPEDPQCVSPAEPNPDSATPASQV
jgi:hypothetical protein